MIIREAIPEDYRAIAKIWEACFTDDLYYIENYIKYCLPFSRCLIVEISPGIIVSSLSLIPSFVIEKNIRYNGFYLYAVGTLPEYRGNSFSSQLLNRALQISREENISYIIVRPATESLYTLYNKLGFNHTLLEEVVEISVANIPDNKHNKLINRNLTGEDLLILRNSSSGILPENSFDRPNIVQADCVNSIICKEELSYPKHYDIPIQIEGNKFLWPLPVLKYAILEALERKGLCLIIENLDSKNNNNLYFLSYPDENDSTTINILESNFHSMDDLSIISKFILNKYPETKLLRIFLGSESNILNGKKKRAGLILSFKEDNPYSLQHKRLFLPLE